MNDPDRENPLEDALVTNAIEEQALDWLLRKDRGGWSEGNQLALDAWLSKSWAHTVAYWRAEAAWERADRLGAMRHVIPPHRTPSHNGARRTALKAAAVVVFAVIAAGLVTFYRPVSSGKLYSTDVGGYQTLALTDGTRIELNTDTAIRVSLQNNRRLVRIEKGEAFFDVKHDAKRPFTVTAGNARVVDLGTQFSVRKDAGRLQVTLLEGHAEISVADSRPASLSPGDVALATTVAVSVTKKKLPALSRDLSWRRGVLVFDNTTLAEVAAQFNRYNRIKLVLANASTAEVTVGGTFATGDVTAFARVAKNILGLHVESRNEEIVVSRR